MEVYISDVASFLPNEPVENHEIEQVLGMVGDIPSNTREMILKKNGIRTRHYAVDPATGRQSHTNAQLTAEAIGKLSPHGDFSPEEIQCLACGTSSPDQLKPGHGPMVHGELGTGPCEVVTTAGICLAGMTAFKYACMNIAAGFSDNAVATGSELASSFIGSHLCKFPETAMDGNGGEKQVLPFEADFLRWMLSDGAGAAFLTNAPVSNGMPSLKVEWLEHLSFAGQLPTCMYSGAIKEKDGSIRGWRQFSSIDRAAEQNAFLIKQDASLLNREIVVTAVDRTLTRVIEKHNLDAAGVDWFLPHYSSDFFRKRLYNHMKAIGFEIPEEKWFTNLATCGNTGAASIYIMLDELFHSGRLKKGEKVLCFIPESGRFSMCYMMLTVA